MPTMHPFTVVVGIIAAIAVALMVTFGLLCGLYLKDPESHPHLKWYYEVAKACKLCDQRKN